MDDKKIDDDFSETRVCINYDLPNQAVDGLTTVQQLEFKTCLFEVVEELRIRRAAESRYEEQIRNFVVEKQELEWQKESLQCHCGVLSSQHEEALAALKKQFQTQIAAVEEEKGKFHLSAETKEREINGLKEELKVLQISKYNLEKKLNELEQKVQLQTVAKGNHLSQLSEVEKRFAAISRQYTSGKQAHEKLEQNVEEAMRLNKKLMGVNKNQESVIHDLKQCYLMLCRDLCGDTNVLVQEFSKELEKVTADLIRSKVTSHCKLGEENLHLTALRQQLQELNHKLQMQLGLNKRLSNDVSAIQEAKQQILKSLQNAQQLQQHQELALGRTVTELKICREKYQARERDNEVLREKASQNEDRYQVLKGENKKSTAEWKMEEMKLIEEINIVKSELASLKEAYAYYQAEQNKAAAQKQEQTQLAQLNHLEQKDKSNEICGLQNRTGKALMMINDKSKVEEIHNVAEEEIKEEPKNEVENNKENNKRSQDRTVNVGNAVESSSVWPLEIAKLSAEVSVRTTNGVPPSPNENQYISLSAVKVNAAASKGIQQAETGNTCYEADSASANLKSQCSSVCLAEVPVKGGKMLPDRADALGVCSADIGHQTNPIGHKFDGDKTKAADDTNNKTEATQYDKGVFINEPPPKTEARSVPGVDRILPNEAGVRDVRRDTQQPQNQSVAGLVPQTTPENTQQRTSSLRQQLEQTDQLIEKQCVDHRNTVKTVHQTCSESDVSPTVLPADRATQWTSIGACINSGNVDDSKPNVPTQLSNIIPGDSKEAGTAEEIVEMQNAAHNEPRAKETNGLETIVSVNQTKSLEHVCKTILTRENLDRVEYVQNNLAQSDDCVCTSSDHLLKLTSAVDRDFSTQRSQNVNEIDSDSVITVESGQPAFGAMALHSETAETEVESSDMAENKLTPPNGRFLGITNTAVSFKQENKISPHSAAMASSKKCPSFWKFHDVTSFKANRENDDLKKSITSSLARGKLESPNRSAYTFARQASDMRLKRSSVTDSPSAKMVSGIFNTFDAPLSHKRDLGKEWNAIAQTFCDFSPAPEQETSSSEKLKILYQFSLTQHQDHSTESSSASCSNRGVNPSSPVTRLKDAGISNYVPKTATHDLLFTDEPDSEFPLLKGQINEIERFLTLDQLRYTRKRKAEGSNDESEIKIAPII